MKRKLLATCAGFALGLAALLAGAPARTLGPPVAHSSVAASSCPGSTLVPKKSNRVRVRRALLCLVNAQRAQRHAGLLRSVNVLRTAAAKHSADMVRRHYFSHITPSGATPSARLARLGFHPRDAAENIAFGTNQFATPISIMRQWMHSRRHRSNMLSRRFTSIGIGIALGSPAKALASSKGATYTAVFAGG